MEMMCEVGITQRIKNGEVVCGDSVEVIRTEEGWVIVLSDGLGSGVKANILSTLTVKIISRMAAQNVAISDIVETIVGTLPVCSERHVAYSTFTILLVSNTGKLDIVDFDGITPVRISPMGHPSPMERESAMIAGKEIHFGTYQLLEGEYVFISSDGVTEAGLGLGLLKGLQTEGVIKSIRENVKLKDSAQALTDQMVDICMSYYLGIPGDDTSAVAIYWRPTRHCGLLTGAPLDETLDATMVGDFEAIPGKKYICGGTTAMIYARETDKDVIPLNDNLPQNVGESGVELPPMSAIEGIDLVTEGVLTLSQLTNYLENQLPPETEDPAALLMRELLQADVIHILRGKSRNAAYERLQGNGLPLRNRIVNRLREQLEARGKTVEIREY